MSAIENDRFIGQQIKVYRRIRNLTQQRLADHLGISRSAIALYETGRRPIDSRELLYGLAEALQVSIGDLTGHREDKTNPSVAAFHTQVPRIEAAMMSAGHADDSTEPAPLERLAADTQRALKFRMKNDYARLGSLLPTLLHDLYRHTVSGREQQQTRAWEVLTRATFVTALATKGFGYTSLAWNAARASFEAARIVGDPSGLAAAEFARSQVLLSTPGTLGAALAYSADGANRLQGELQTPSELELYGMLHLQAALTSAAVGKDPAPHLAEAVGTARRSGDGSAFELAFGPENVAVWQMSVANELRRAGDALTASRTVHPESIGTEDRKSRYFIELGRAHVMLKDYGAAMSALLRAEHVAPQQVRSRTIVRELVGHMMRTARRDLASGPLGQLAQRVGALPA
ncbi:MAG: helix-turn-helix domain-containing protein [Nocardioidaceae bacterium]